jgi:hypothetical protein
VRDVKVTFYCGGVWKILRNFVLYVFKKSHFNRRPCSLRFIPGAYKYQYIRAAILLVNSFHRIKKNK